MAKQPLKKKEVKGFSVKNFKNDFLGENSKTADKEIEWIIMPSAFQEALYASGEFYGKIFKYDDAWIVHILASMIRGRSDTGKSTLKNCAIASAMRQGILPVIFETEGNFDFQYAKDCGMDITPMYEEVEYIETLRSGNLIQSISGGVNNED